MIRCGPGKIVEGEQKEPWVVERNGDVKSLIDLEMSRPIKLKLVGMVEGKQDNVLAKEFF